MFRLLKCVAFVGLCLAVPTRALAAPTVINFETLGEGDSVTNQFAGLTFASATVITAGSNLNELEFPPHSGVNVVFDDGGPISIAFSSPVAGFGGFFTYGLALTLTAFDASHTPLGQVTSLFSNNELLSGESLSSPNEFLQFSSALGIASVTIAGDPAGGSFVLDDVTITDRVSTSPVPEPGTLTLALVGAIGLASRVRARRTGA